MLFAGNYSEATSMAAGGVSTRFSMESSCVGLQSSRVKVESSTDNALTRYVQPTALTSTPGEHKSLYIELLSYPSLLYSCYNICYGATQR